MKGYSKLASFMTEKHHPILKKYRHLATRDLLFLQAELCYLDHQYESIAKKSATEKNERQYYDQDWFLMQSSASRGLDGEQWAIATATRAKLREYYTAIAQYSQIASIREPKESERSILHEWIGSASLGGGCGFLSRDLAGYEQPSVYDAIHQNDLAILSDSHGEDDLFTKFVTGPLLRCYHSVRGHSRASSPSRLYDRLQLTIPKPSLPIDPENPPVEENRSGLHYYDDRNIEVVTNILGTVLSSLAPLVSIIVLSFVVSGRARLGLVCLFTALFSLSLAIATKARRVEIFAATAAFASVQVVFVGSTNSAI